MLVVGVGGSVWRGVAVVGMPNSCGAQWPAGRTGHGERAGPPAPSAGITTDYHRSLLISAGTPGVTG